MHNGILMFSLLQSMREVRLTEQGVEAFLMRAAKLMIIGELTNDDWFYLTHLIMFKLTKAKGIVIL